MNTQKTTPATQGFALFSSRVSLHESACAYWMNEARKVRDNTPEGIAAFLTVQFVTSVISRTLDLRDGKHEANGIAAPRISPARGEGRLQSQALAERAQSMMNTAYHEAKGKRPATRRNAFKLSDADRGDIQSAVSLVLATREAYHRPLESKDWSECFSRVESKDCLGLNRRMKRLENATREEITLSRLASPVYDSEIDEWRVELLESTRNDCLAWIDAASRIDKGRKAQATRAKWISYLEDVCEGNEEAGKPDKKTATAETLKNYKREKRRKRADFKVYLETGKLALQAERLTRSAYLPAQVALEAITLQ